MNSAKPDFEDLFHHNYDQLVWSLTAITGDRETARDCVQDAFITAADRWSRVRCYDQPAAWIRRVAINRSRDLHRSELRRQRRETLASETLVTPEPDNTEDHAIMVDEVLQLRDMFDELTPRQRSVAVLRYIDDRSVADIACDLGISTGAVRFHLARARAGLRAAIAEGAGTDDGRKRQAGRRIRPLEGTAW